MHERHANKTVAAATTLMHPRYSRSDDASLARQLTSSDAQPRSPLLPRNVAGFRPIEASRETRTLCLPASFRHLLHRHASRQHTSVT